MANTVDGLSFGAPNASGWEYASDPDQAGIQIGYDPNAKQSGGGTGPAWDISDPSTGQYDSGQKQWATSLQQALSQYQTANGTTPKVPGTSSAPNAQAASGSLTNALQPNYAPTPPQATTAQSNAPTGLTQQQLNALSPDQTIQQILAAYTPAAQQSQNNLNQSLAASGVSGGGAVGATQQLQGQLAAGLGSSLAGAVQNSQGNILNAEELGSNQQLQQSLYNAGAQNSGNQYNTSNLINAENGNISTSNNFEQYLAGLNNTDWLAQLQGFTGLNESGLSGQQGINQTSAGNYGIQTGAGAATGSLTSALGNYYGSSSPVQAGAGNGALTGSAGYYGATDYGNGDSSAG